MQGDHLRLNLQSVAVAGNEFESEVVWHDLFDDEMFMNQFNDTEEKQNLYREYFSFKSRASAKKDSARINVYMADSTMIQTQESLDYEIRDLISDVGGQLSIWVGMSVVTTVKTFALFAQLLSYFFWKSMLDDVQSSTA